MDAFSDLANPGPAGGGEHQERPPQGDGSALVEQNPHSGHGCSRAAGGVLQHQPCLLPGRAGEEFNELRQGDSVLEVFE